MAIRPICSATAAGSPTTQSPPGTAESMAWRTSRISAVHEPLHDMLRQFTWQAEWLSCIQESNRQIGSCGRCCRHQISELRALSSGERHWSHMCRSPVAAVAAAADAAGQAQLQGGA